MPPRGTAQPLRKKGENLENELETDPFGVRPRKLKKIQITTSFEPVHRQTYLRGDELKYSFSTPAAPLASYGTLQVEEIIRSW